MHIQSHPETFVDYLISRSGDTQPVFTYLHGDDKAPETMSPAQLDAKSRAIAGRLQSMGLTGGQALLLYPSGLDFITAFFGCLYAGVTAVPAYPPRKNKSLERLQSIIKDCAPGAVLATASVQHFAEPMFSAVPELSALPWITSDTLESGLADAWAKPDLTADSLAFLQYTSGSTGTPKGVMISHGNLIHNQMAMADSFGLTPASIGVGWLPLFHDMGLIGMALHPLYIGFPITLMPPASFLQQPVRWLQAISDCRATATVAPNFAFDLCAREIAMEHRANLDLSSLEFVLCGAEPVRHESLERFAEAFAPCGFDRRVFRPAYGLAEDTVLATCSAPNYQTKSIDAVAMTEGRFELCSAGDESSQIMTGLGRPCLGQDIAIADSETGLVVAEGGIGEIWITGGSVAQGYWNKPEESEQLFKSQLAGDERYFLRTGDLGCFYQGELFITGRLKDLIIIGGKNHYPQDIEWSVDQIFVSESAPMLQYGAAAAFSVSCDGGERLVVAVETTRDGWRELRRDSLALEIVIAAVRRAVACEHQLQVHEVVLLKPGHLPRTSSGKVRRRRCREALQKGELELVSNEVVAGEVTVADPVTPKVNRSEMQHWLQQQAARLLGLKIAEIDVNEDLANYGMSSISALRLVGELETWLGRKISPNMAWDHPSIVAMSDYLANDASSHDALTVFKLDPDAAHQPFHLNQIQHAYWLGRSGGFALGNTGCHFYAEFEGKGLDVEQMSAAWQKLVLRHGMLRSVVQADGQQRVLETVPVFTIPLENLSHMHRNERDAHLSTTRSVMSHRVYEPAQWPMFDIRAHQLQDEVIRLHFSIDLLIADVWSMLVLLKEWELLYRTPSVTLPALELSFRDCLLAEQETHQGKAYQDSFAYWRARSADLPGGPKLPLAINPERIDKPMFARREMVLSAPLWSALKARASSLSITPSMLLCSAYAEVLGAWSKDSRFSLTLTLFNRPPRHAQIDNVVGDFTSVLLLEVDGRGNDSFAARTERLQRQFHQDLAHSAVSGVEVLRMANAGGSMSTSMPVVFTSALGGEDRTGSDSVGMVPWPGKRVYSISQTPQVWLDHQVMEINGDLMLSWDAVEAIFPAGVLDDMFQAYSQLLHELATEDAAWHRARPKLVPAAHLELVRQANDVFAPAPSGLLHEPFITMAMERGDAPAVISSRQCLSHKQLYQASNRIAHRLRSLGAEPNTLVAVVMEKGCEQIAAVMGILQSGAAYLPIDPALPKDRIWTILDLADAKLVLTQSWVQDAQEWPPQVKVISLERDDLSMESSHQPDLVQQPSDLAYVIFTSGSTGTPKGVMIDHAGALNTVIDINQRFGVTAADKVLAVSSLSFDLSVYDIFGILGAGGAMVIPDAVKHNDPQHWAEMMDKHHVSVWNSAPALMENLLEYSTSAQNVGLNDIRLAMMSGDWIPLHVPTQLKRVLSDVEVVSLGGATEASIWSIFHVVDEVNPEWRSIPYGKPLTNQTFYVLDEQFQPRPLWVTGQLYIGGIGLAKGYWKNHERTQASFVTHPVTGETLYKTGDLGRLMPNGEIEFLGREDFQVKIQGYRIELGEIESTLNRHPAIMGSVVNAWTDPAGAKHLVAYVLPLLEIDRVAINVPCVVVDQAGQDYLLRAVDISSTGVRLDGVPESWEQSQPLTLSMQIGDAPERHRFQGVIDWTKDGQAGVDFELDDAKAELLAQALRKLAVEQDEHHSVSNFRYRATDGRRACFRVPFEQNSVALHDVQAYDLDIRELSCDGARLDNVPAHLKAGDKIQLHLTLPPEENSNWFHGTIMWRKGNVAGLHFLLTPTEEARLAIASAYITSRDGYWLNERRLAGVRDYLAESLPAYMVPRHYMLLPSLPLSSNGKVDRNALPAPHMEGAGSSTPRGGVEAELAKIWSEVLGVSDIGVNDNFFELGGYSQLAVRALLRIRERFQSDLPLRALFESPTIAALAERLSNSPLAGAALQQDESIEGSLYGQYARRGIYHRIQAIRADKDYTSAFGLALTYTENGEQHQVLDLVGGYGSTMLGHNHQELTEYAVEIMRNGVPAHAQHTDNTAAGMLGKRLSDKIGAYTGRRYVATLASTGTEAVEAAIKHAKQEFTSRSSNQKANDDNLAALLLHQVRKNQLQLKESAWLEVESITGKEIARTPRALVKAIQAYNEEIYEQEPLFLALSHSFHGMTSGSLSLTASTDFRKPFHWMGIRAQWISHRVRALQTAVELENRELLAIDLGANQELRIVRRAWCGIGGLFIEPIQGEGGIYPVTQTFTSGARETADKYGFPIIIDEIQCGMGRSGTFCAAEQVGLVGDYYVFSKSLGGGLSKVSALMVDEHRYQKDFGYYHGSTFAEDRPSCMIALKALEIMDRDELVTRAGQQGTLFMQKLHALRGRYPELIADVRGRGLMIGLELASLNESPSFLLRALSHGGMEILNYLIAGYMLNQHNVRIAPTKTRNTIRFLPSAYISEAEMDQAISALDAVFGLIQKANPGRLMRYVVDVGYDESVAVTDWRGKHPDWRDDETDSEPRVAHIGHLEDAASLLLAEPSMAEIPEELREELLHVLFPVSKVGAAQQMLVTTNTGEKVHLSVIGLALTGGLFEKMMGNAEERELLLEKIDEAIALAEKSGCTVIGFGGYTSIVTANCTSVATTSVAMTSGNSYTTALGIEGLKREALNLGIQLGNATIGVVGAKGNIGSISARLLAQDAGRVILFGREAGDDGLVAVAHAIYQDAWERISNGQAAAAKANPMSFSGVEKSMLYFGDTVARAAQAGDQASSGARIYEALLVLGDKSPVRVSTDLKNLGECDGVVSATNSSRPVIFPEYLSQRTSIICDIATPSDVSPSVAESCPWVTVISGGLARLPGTPGVQLMGTTLPVDHVFGCVAETCLLGLAGYEEHFSFGDMDKAQVDYISAEAKRHGFGLGKVKRSATHVVDQASA